VGLLPHPAAAKAAIVTIRGRARRDMGAFSLSVKRAP
jgi:hypothetical protein